MLKSSIAALLLLFVFTACTKDNDEPSSKTDILTSKPWVYDLYITRFNTTNSIYQYKKGKPYNALNLTNDWIKFDKDGTYTRKDYQGLNKAGTWKFVNDETGVSTTEDGVTHTNTIRLLTKDRYTWYDPADDAYGEMIPQ
jgi:hypothetical protein